MNSELMLRAVEAMEEEPRRANMNQWARVSEYEDPNNPPCGTVGCLYGWAVAITKNVRRHELKALLFPRGALYDNGGCGINEYNLRGAAVLFDITVEQAKWLCTVDYWPWEFARRETRALKGTPAYVQVIRDRVEFFIATNGTDIEKVTYE